LTAPGQAGAAQCTGGPGQDTGLEGAPARSGRPGPGHGGRADPHGKYRRRARRPV